MKTIKSLGALWILLLLLGVSTSKLFVSTPAFAFGGDDMNISALDQEEGDEENAEEEEPMPEEEEE